MVLCLTGYAYAETQSVKVSGDLTMRGFLRDAYDYQGAPNETPAPRAGITRSDQTWFMTNAEVQIDADLTDNVATCIRLVNQRDWNVRTKSIMSTNSLAMNGNGGYTANADEFQVALDLAYVTLKDFIYSPLTLTIGRQDLWFGRGFIVGANLETNNPTAALTAPEYSSLTAFDSIKAVLDYDPWKITGLYSVIHRNAVQDSDSVDLWGIDVGYMFDSYKAEAEGYWFTKQDRQVDQWSTAKYHNSVHTLGLRGSLDPIDVLTVNLEGAYQFGKYIGTRNQINSRNRSAWAFDAGLEWRFFMEKYAWKPKLGFEYIYYSGNKPESNPDVASGDYSGWDPMYRGKFDSAIREFVGEFYTTSRYPARGNYLQSCADASFTNQNQFVFSGSLQPIESVTLKGNCNIFYTDEDYLVNVDKSGGYIGTELDLNANWDYTEDVSFGLLAGWFFPGTVYYDNRSDIATDIVGSVKVSF